jgi:hypothetical protein
MAIVFHSRGAFGHAKYGRRRVRLVKGLLKQI